MDTGCVAVKPPATDANTLTLRNLSIDTKKHTVKVDNIEIKLTRTEYELLKCLVSNKGIAFTREQIMNKVWGYDYLGETNVVDVFIRFLRVKLDDRFNTKFIYTLRGVGYLVKDAD